MPAILFTCNSFIKIDCQLSIKLILNIKGVLYISHTIKTNKTYTQELSEQLQHIGLEAKYDRCKVVQYDNQIWRDNKVIETCVIFYLDDEIGKEIKESKVKFETLTPNDELFQKIEKKDWACLEFLSIEGDTVAVHEKNF